MDHPKSVADAAANLAEAIQAARSAGYRVIFAEHTLAAIPVSDTGRTLPAAPPAPEEPPVPVIGKASSKGA